MKALQSKGGVEVIMSMLITPKNKISSNVHKIEGAHLQCVNNQNAKFEYKGMKTARVTDRRMDRVDTQLDLHFAKVTQAKRKS